MTKDALSPASFVQQIIKWNQNVTHGPLGIRSRMLQPQYVHCPFCAANFDFIGKLENMDEDNEFLSDLLGFQV